MTLFLGTLKMSIYITDASFLFAPSMLGFGSQLMESEYFAKYVRDSPPSTGHQLALAYLAYIENGFRGPLKPVLEQAHMVRILLWPPSHLSS